jgi:hypothetical protein
MHKTIKTTLSLAVGVALALGVPLAASASPVQPAAAVASQSLVAAHNTGKTDDHKKSDNKGDHGKGSLTSYNKGHKKPLPKHHPKPTPSHTKPAYPPTKPPKPPIVHHHPWWHGGFWWFPFIFPAHTFHPGATVHVWITGFGGFSFFGTFQASESGSLNLGTAAADGSLNATLKASGAKDLAGQTLNATVSDNAGTSVSQSIAVPAATSASSTAATTTSSLKSVKSVDSASLAQSGTYISLATVWGAIGLLALGAAFLAMRTITRRRNRTTNL